MNSTKSDVSIQLKQATEILKAGGIVAFPTDTVYGLGADIYNVKAIERIFEVKQRPKSIALPVLLGEIEQINEVAASVTEIAHIYMRQFWPGGLTLVLPKASWIPRIITANSDKVAVRLPNHEITRALINRLGSPIVGTSANISGRSTPVMAEEVIQQLGSKVDFVIYAGRSPGGVESTVVDINDEKPIILREGIIPAYIIEKIWRETLKEANNSAHRSG